MVGSVAEVNIRGGGQDSHTMLDKKNTLSTKNISPKDRLIFALDYSSTAEAREMVDLLGDTVTFYKLGWRLL
jgi:hypothetical protein